MRSGFSGLGIGGSIVGVSERWVNGAAGWKNGVVAMRTMRTWRWEGVYVF